MKKLLFVTVLAVAAQLTGACDVPDQSFTRVTFTINAFHQTTLDPVVPLIDVTATVPGYATWEVADDTSAPYQFTINSLDYTEASESVDITAQPAEPNPDVVLRCTWVASTPAGVRLSRDSTGGEGESHAGQPVNCSYKA
jgi:hypothetical protein